MSVTGALLGGALWLSARCDWERIVIRIAFDRVNTAAHTVLIQVLVLFVMLDYDLHSIN